MAVPFPGSSKPICLMAKSLPSATRRLQQFAKVVVSSSSSENPQSATPKPKSNIRVSPSQTPISGTVRVESEETNRVPLGDVVSDCVKRWFRDTLKEANAGDRAMQVLLGQMLCSGYGVPIDTRKVT